MSGTDHDDMQPEGEAPCKRPRESPRGDASAASMPPAHVVAEPSLSDVLASITSGNCDIARQFEEVQLKQCAMETKLETVVSRQEAVEQRLTALEARDKLPAFPPVIASTSAASGVPSRSSSVAGDRASRASSAVGRDDRGRDVVFKFDPWAKGRGKGKLQSRDPDFQPSRAWLRGWSP
jgi:hypothetical protein